MAEKGRLRELFNKYLRKECTPEEVRELVQLLQERSSDETLDTQLQKLWLQEKQKAGEYPVDWDTLYRKIRESGSNGTIRTKASMRGIVLRVAAAAAVLLLLSGGWLLRSQYATSPQSNVATTVLKDATIYPGGNKAILTLANGKRIVLNHADKGTLARQGQSKVVKLDSGKLAYHSDNHAVKEGVIEYNTLKTPVGGTYSVQLPDGTKVWLNAASSIRFPTAFSGHQRQVEITGEAYFEVAQKAKDPFIVHAKGMMVKVLGTHFNINAYDNEKTIKTTLLEGKVRVQSLTKKGNAIVLSPGQEARLNKNGILKFVESRDLKEAVAWKNGLFLFHNDALPGIMRRLARWYDIQVVYKGDKIPGSHFTGAVRRQVNISEVLKMLELTGGVHFSIKGRKIIVSS